MEIASVNVTIDFQRNTAAVTVSLKNFGFSAPINPRNLTVILVSAEHTVSWVDTPTRTVDWRQWQPTAPSDTNRVSLLHTFTAVGKADSLKPGGAYSVGISLRDPVEVGCWGWNAVAFANAGVSRLVQARTSARDASTPCYNGTQLVGQIKLASHPRGSDSRVSTKQTVDTISLAAKRDLHNATLLDLPARYMWGWGPGLSGFCGSVTIQTAGLYYGNWLTENAIRGTSGGYNGRHQLYIAFPKDLDIPSTSMLSACVALKLNCSMWDYDTAANPQHTAFLRWAVAGIQLGYPVGLGLYWGVEDDPDFDHIVPMVGFDSHPGGEPAAVYFNDLHTNATLRVEVNTFVRSRKQCHDAHRFGPSSFCLPKKVDYGMRVLGNADPTGELLPVRLHVNRVDEPDYSREDKHHQKPVWMRAQVAVHGLESGRRYVLLRYEEMEAVPVKEFLKAPAVQRHEFTAASTEYARNVTFISNSTTFFRCVQAPGKD